MSEIHEALRRAQGSQPVSGGRPIIQIPFETKTAKKPSLLSASLSLIVLAVLGAMAVQLWLESETRMARERDLNAKIQALDAKHEKLMTAIGHEDRYLDTRVQLDLMELKTNYRALTTQMDLLGAKDIERVRADQIALRDYVKQEMFFLNRRLHENEREHAQLSDRSDALGKAASS